MVRDVDGVSEATALFGEALTEWGPWRRLDREPAEQGEMAPPVTGREPAEQGGEAPSVAVPADRVDAVDAEEQPRPSERERRWADRVEEDESSGAPTPVWDDTEDEDDEAGPPTPPPCRATTSRALRATT